ncbi:GntR family transcriptional regulator [Streptomyces sp. NPDC051840]|uniref:GntR family transcriptional regulator n=1 Tax=unclassified Streptomyces TaxID=2593676 RepID=UPI003431296F
MLLRLNVADARPLHEQVAGAIRRAIAEEEWRPGDRLPPARDISQALGVNVNTVLRGLRALRAQGVLEFRRGRGVTVADRADGADGRSALLERVGRLVADASRLGYSKADLMEMIRGME